MSTTTPDLMAILTLDMAGATAEWTTQILAVTAEPVEAARMVGALSTTVVHLVRLAAKLTAREPEAILQHLGILLAESG